jgi:hypothetical protein
VRIDDERRDDGDRAQEAVAALAKREDQVQVSLAFRNYRWWSH